MKIAMLGHKRIPSREGGIEIVVEELATRMTALGHKVICYNRGGQHVIGNKFEGNTLNCYKGVDIVQVPTLDFKGLAAVTSSFFAALKAALSDADIVHFHAEGPCAMLWLPKLFGKRCIVTIHGLDHQRAKWGSFARSYIMLGERCAAKYADEIIVLSNSVQNYFKQHYGRDTRFIPNGVNPPKLKKANIISDVFSLEKDGYILYLGRIVPEKGLRYLIEAFMNLKTDKKLVIAGTSSDTDSFLKEVKKMSQGDERIIFTGFVQGAMLQELYSNAWVYVLPSDLEGMPLSLLEAMSYGNCCLVSDIPECAQVVEDKAVTFKKSNTLDLQYKLKLLCEDCNLVASYKADASAFIIGKCNWDKVVEQTLELYRRK